jgi:hypothetical protein
MNSIQPSELNASALLPVSRDHHQAAALEACAATFRTAPVDSTRIRSSYWSRGGELSQGLKRFLIFGLWDSKKLKPET